MCVFLNQSYDSWQKSLVKTDLNTTAFPVDRVPFPSVTICAEGTLRQTMEAAYMHDVRQLIKVRLTSTQKSRWRHCFTAK